MLGSVGTGQYVAAFSFSTVFGVFIDIGFGSLLTRELARRPDESSTLFRTVVAVKLVLASLVYPLLVGTTILLAWLGVGHPPIALTAIAGLVMILDSMTLSGTSVFRGWQNLSFEAITIVANKTVIFLFGVVALWLWADPLSVAVALFSGSFVSLALVTHFLRRHIASPWRPLWNRERAQAVSRLAVPFAFATVFATLYAQVDSVLLTMLKGEDAVGLYSVAAKTMNAFAFIPAAFAAALYPAMSADFSQGGHRLQYLLEESQRYLLMIAAPLAVGLYVLADQFVGIVGAEYAAAAPAVRILLPSLVFVFLSFPLGSLMNATNRQHWQTWLIVAMTVCNIVLNIFLIPRWSFIGASVAWLATNVVGTLLAYAMVMRAVPFRVWPLLLSLLRTGSATVVMAFIVLLLRDVAPLVLVVAASGVLYVAVLFMTRELSIATVHDFIRTFLPTREEQP